MEINTVFYTKRIVKNDNDVARIPNQKFLNIFSDISCIRENF